MKDANISQPPVVTLSPPTSTPKFKDPARRRCEKEQEDKKYVPVNSDENLDDPGPSSSVKVEEATEVLNDMDPEPTFEGQIGTFTLCFANPGTHKLGG